jgi:predicted RNA-binding Zn-ribbon protein involved in translation (DUF1610 family)
MREFFLKIHHHFVDFFGPIMEGWDCPNCGEKNFYRDYCRKCGYKLTEGVDF